MSMSSVRRITVVIAVALLAASAANAVTGRAVSMNALASALKGGSTQAAGLCGITRVTGYLVDSQSRDVILVGEVRPGLPAMHADDFAVALRAAWLMYARTQGRVRYYTPPGCSIDPNPTVLRELQGVGDRLSQCKGDSEAEKVLSQWEAVGRKRQNVRVMGVPYDTRFAKVMVDADYYMKRLVNGSVQLGIDGFVSLSDMHEQAARKAMAAGDTDAADGQTMSRFWFSPGEATYTEEDGVVQLASCAVQLLTEQEFLTEHGKVAGMGRPDPMAAEFARGFTAKWDAIAAARPIYRELEGLFRFVGLARLMNDAKVKCTGLTYLLKSHPVAKVPVSRAVLGLTRVREIKDEKQADGATSVYRMWLTSCGGVSMDVRPKRVGPASHAAQDRRSAPVVSSTRSGKPTAAANSVPKASKAPSAAVRAPSLRKAILAARKSPHALAWDFPVAGK